MTRYSHARTCDVSSPYVCISLKLLMWATCENTNSSTTVTHSMEYVCFNCWENSNGKNGTICASIKADSGRYKAKYCIQGGNISWYVLYEEKWCCKDTEGYKRSKENTVIRCDVLGKYWIFLNSACLKIGIRRNFLFISWQLLKLLLWKPLNTYT